MGGGGGGQFNFNITMPKLIYLSTFSLNAYHMKKTKHWCLKMALWIVNPLVGAIAQLLEQWSRNPVTRTSKPRRCTSALW